MVECLADSPLFLEGKAVKECVLLSKDHGGCKELNTALFNCRRPGVQSTQSFLFYSSLAEIILRVSFARAARHAEAHQEAISTFRARAIKRRQRAASKRRRADSSCRARVESVQCEKIYSKKTIRGAAYGHREPLRNSHKSRTAKCTQTIEAPQGPTPHTRCCSLQSVSPPNPVTRTNPPTWQLTVRSRLRLGKPPDFLQQLRLDLVGHRPCGGEWREQEVGLMKSVCVCVCATRVSVLERSAPRPRGIISAVSCSTVIVWSPLLRMSSAYAVGRRALMSGYSQARTFLERRRRARKKGRAPIVYSLRLSRHPLSISFCRRCSLSLRCA